MRMKVLAVLSLASLLCAQSLPEMRMLPEEMRGGAVDGNQIGSSGLAGVHTKVLFGDPSKAFLFDPAIRAGAHDDPGPFAPRSSHGDGGVRHLVLRLWRSFRREVPQDASLRAASIRTRAHNHFARTDKDVVIVHISGYGPTDTRYFNPADEPKPAQ